MSEAPYKPRLAITLGDINGVGPEIVVKAFARPEPWAACHPVILGSLEVLEEARRRFAQCPPFLRVEGLKECRDVTDALPVMDCGHPIAGIRAGELDPRAGAAAVVWFQRAVELALSGGVEGIVTCPISKECINQAGYDYSGHTDMIAELTHARDYRMSLFTDSMRIVHITGHLSLRDALDAVRRERIVDSIRMGYDALVRLGLESPKIAVAGLNPHAGEAGRFGREEIEEIGPAVVQCQAEGIPCSGPYPPDTLFGRMRDGEFDMVIAMYHDQGHIPLKLIAMDEGVNVTLGLPVVRTSVDHGTAYDIAWQGRAREHSLIAATRFAAQLAGRRVGKASA